jgi:hypothetical protein
MLFKFSSYLKVNYWDNNIKLKTESFETEHIRTLLLGGKMKTRNVLCESEYFYINKRLSVNYLVSVGIHQKQDLELRYANEQFLFVLLGGLHYLKGTVSKNFARIFKVFILLNRTTPQLEGPCSSSDTNLESDNELCVYRALITAYLVS